MSLIRPYLSLTLLLVILLFLLLNDALAGPFGSLFIAGVSAFTGARISIYYQRKDEFEALKSELRSFIKLSCTGLDYTDWFQEPFPTGAKLRLTMNGSIAMMGVRYSLHHLRTQLKEQEYEQLARIVSIAEAHYKNVALNGVDNPEDLHLRALGFPESVDGAKPEFGALIKGKRVPTLTTLPIQRKTTHSS